MLASRLFNRIPRQTIEAALAGMGVRRGDSILALVSLRSVGYVVDGARAFVEALASAVGPEGSLMLPAFPAVDPLPAPPESGEFDELETPSAAGLVSEAFRLRPGTLRSLHPVGSMAASGPRAGEWLRGHETGKTPFGAGSPIDRFVASGGRLLIVGAHAGPILPYLQEKAAFPHLYRPGKRSVTIRTRRGQTFKIGTPVFRSESCRVVILQGERPETRDYVVMRDYALVFPAEREKRLAKGGYVRHNHGRLVGRLERLRQRKVVSSGTIGSAEALLVDAGPFCEQVGADLTWEVERFKDEYDPDRLQTLELS
ncbi:MAG: AAC(3) family N-acetyltransferase [Acidobacteria bacterium]|nr:AAC(3) family N-acetyltransferase [Acidobacteriota bacterium]